MDIPEVTPPSPYSIQHCLLQKLEQQRTEGDIVLPATGSKVFSESFYQTEWAMRLLNAACQLYETSPLPARRVLLPQLISAAVLLFKTRDQWAFEQIFASPVYEALALGTKLRQLPTFEQLTAVLESKRKAADEAWQTLSPEANACVAGIQALSDKALEVEGFRQFRDRLIQQELPLEQEAEAGAAFPQARVDYMALAEEALAGWEALKKQIFRA